MMTSLVLSLLLLVGGDSIGATNQIQNHDSHEHPPETTSAFKGDPCWTW